MRSTLEERTSPAAAFGAVAGLLGMGVLSAGARRAGLLDPFDRHMQLPAAATPARRRTWLTVTALGSRPLAYTAVAARCLSQPGPAADPAAWWPLVVLAGGDLTRTVLCRAVARPRPPEAGRLAPCHGPSFPSRHTAMAVTAAHLVAGPTTAGAMAVAVGASRMALRAHWPTDVLGGWLFAYTWLAAARITRTAMTRRTR